METIKFAVAAKDPKHTFQAAHNSVFTNGHKINILMSRKRSATTYPSTETCWGTISDPAWLVTALSPSFLSSGSGDDAVAWLSISSTSTIGFVGFDACLSAAPDFASDFVVFDLEDGSLASVFGFGFLDAIAFAFPLLVAKVSLDLVEFSLELTASEGLSVAVADDLRRPSFGDLGRVGGICM